MGDEYKPRMKLFGGYLEVIDFLLFLAGILVGFGIRPWYNLLTGKDFPLTKILKKVLDE